MIPRIEPSWQGESWQQQWANAIRDPRVLENLLELPANSLDAPAQAIQSFSLRVPLSYVERMAKSAPRDPLLLQVLPQASELIEKKGFSTNPVGDIEAQKSSGILQKYPGRILLITTGACPIHCRYCFRRHYPYANNQATANQWQTALEHIASDPDLGEVILSGGDPLSLSDEKLSPLINALGNIEHVHTLRIHSRLPIVLPDRITSNIINMLLSTKKQVIFVLHANHSAEIEQDVPAALDKLHQAGFTLLNQAVLLKGINDNTEIQARLNKRLFKFHVLPYYLHMLDPVAGASHFDVPEYKALEIIAEMRASLPGYLVPRLVREIAGESSKTPVTY